MTLHIAIDGTKNINKTKQAEKLCKFLQKKNYSVTIRYQPIHPVIQRLLQDNLTNHEKALLKAFDRSYNYYGEDWDLYDLVIWDGSILSDYNEYTDNKVNNEFIKNINRYFPPMDLYIVIRSDQDDNSKYDRILQANNNAVHIHQNNKNTDEIFETIVKKCFEYLPRCNWCGRFFTKSTKNKKYCSTPCRKYAREEQNRENNRNYYNRYKDTLSERTKGQLGSKGANLHGKRDKDIETEKKKIRNAMKSLGLSSRIQ